jgi:hypothetical protein
MAVEILKCIAGLGCALLITGSLFAAEADLGQSVSWSFSSDAVGSAPHGWEVLSGDWTVQGESEEQNRVLTHRTSRDSGSNPAIILSPAPPTRDMRVAVRFKMTGAWPRETTGLVLRWQGPSAFVVVRVDGSLGWVWVDRIQNGRRSVVAGYATPPIRADDWNSLRVFAVGEWVMLFINGKFLGGVRDDGPATGRLGLLMGPEGGVLLDDLIIEPGAPG